LQRSTTRKPTTSKQGSGRQAWGPRIIGAHLC